MNYYVKLLIYFCFHFYLCTSQYCVANEKNELVNDSLHGVKINNREPYHFSIQGGIFSFRLDNYFKAPILSNTLPSKQHLRNGYHTELGFGRKLITTVSVLLFNRVGLLNSNKKEDLSQPNSYYKINDGKAVSLSGAGLGIYYKYDNTGIDKMSIYTGIKYSMIGFKDSRYDSSLVQPAGYGIFKIDRKYNYSTLEATLSTRYHLIKTLYFYIDYSLLLINGVITSFQSPNGGYNSLETPFMLFDSYKTLTIYNFKIGFCYNINLQ
jgi:hypothetical protein